MKFLAENGLNPESINAEAILSAFYKEMKRGLAGEGPIPMIPSNFALPENLPKNCERVAFDVGGTNTRSARIKFDNKGQATVLNQIRGHMPGTQGEVSHDEFYQALCDVLIPNIHDNETLGYCFSYPVDQQDRLLFWTKCIQAPSIVNTNICESLQEALESRGTHGNKVRFVNDTVATLLTAYTAHGSVNVPGDAEIAGTVGFILGTGINIAYCEHSSSILKAPGLPANAMIPINCESSNFNLFPRSRFDERYESLLGTTHSQWEMCCSGAHLGPLGTEILHTAAESKLFSPELNARLLASNFSNVELDNFCSGKSPDLIDCNEDERNIICEIMCVLYKRVAIFAAINIAVASLLSAEANGKANGHILINADGSTFWKTASIPFVDIVKSYLDSLLGSRGFTYEIIKMKDAPLIGAAIAAF